MQLLRHNVGLVMSLAQRCRGHGVPHTDLVEEGMQGLMRALRKFEPDKGFRWGRVGAGGEGGGGCVSPSRQVLRGGCGGSGGGPILRRQGAHGGFGAWLGLIAPSSSLPDPWSLPPTLLPPALPAAWVCLLWPPRCSLTSQGPRSPPPAASCLDCFPPSLPPFYCPPLPGSPPPSHP